MRSFLRVCLILFLTISFFEILIRIAGKDRLDSFANFVAGPEAHPLSPESIKYKDWFYKNYDKGQVQEWKTRWLTASNVQLSSSLRYLPPLEQFGIPQIYAPGRRNFAIKSIDGQVLHDAIVNIDADGFRRTILPEKVDKSVAYIFLGDSFTFGYGLNDSETFCSKFALFQNSFVKNMGILNSGPNDLLYMFRDHSKLKFPELDAKDIKIIYTFNMEYYGRVFMNSERVEEGVHHYYSNKPYYRKKNGKLEYRGRFDDQTLMVTLYKLYNLSAANTVLRHVIHPDWEDLNGDFALFFKELKEFLIYRYPNSNVELYFSTFPFKRDLPNPKLLDELKHQGVETISLLNTPLEDILPEENLRLPADWHPSPMSTLVYARMLADYFDNQVNRE